MFDDEFLSSIPENTFEALKNTLKHFEALDDGDFEEERYENYIKAYAFLQVLSETHDLKLEFEDLDKIQRENHISYIRKAFYENTTFIIQELESHHRKRIFEDSKAHFSIKMGKTFAYEFSEGDLKKIQTNINELRELISESKIIEKDHQQRLLKRLERLQSELHKRVSDFDRILGLIGDAGVLIGKLGNDAKPMVDRIREIVGIVWRTQSKAEELESGAPNLFLSEGEKEE